MKTTVYLLVVACIFALALSGCQKDAVIPDPPIPPDTNDTVIAPPPKDSVVIIQKAVLTQPNVWACAYHHTWIGLIDMDTSAGLTSAEFVIPFVMGPEDYDPATGIAQKTFTFFGADTIKALTSHHFLGRMTGTVTVCFGQGYFATDEEQGNLSFHKNGINTITWYITFPY